MKAQVLMDQPRGSKAGKRSKEMIDGIVELSGAIPMFNKFDYVQLGIIAEHMQLVELAEGQRLFSEGDDSDYMGFIVDGKLDLFKQSRSGKAVAVSTLARGRLLGEMAMLDSYPRSVTVVARTDCRLLVLSRESFEHILKTRPRLGIELMQDISRSLSLNLRRTSGLLADVHAQARTSGAPTLLPIPQAKAKQPGFIDQIINKKPSGLPSFIRQFG